MQFKRDVNQGIKFKKTPLRKKSTPDIQLFNLNKKKKNAPTLINLALIVKI